MNKPVRYVATALITQNDKILICQRPSHKGNALKWEFVGGKTEKGETLQRALVRECREELDVGIEVGEKIISVTHEYPDIIAEITMFSARITDGTPEMLEHVDMKWIKASEIDDFDFCVADTAILEKVKALMNNLS